MNFIFLFCWKVRRGPNSWWKFTLRAFAFPRSLVFPSRAALFLKSTQTPGLGFQGQKAGPSQLARQHIWKWFQGPPAQRLAPQLLRPGVEKPELLQSQSKRREVRAGEEYCLGNITLALDSPAPGAFQWDLRSSGRSGGQQPGAGRYLNTQPCSSSGPRSPKPCPRQSPGKQEFTSRVAAFPFHPAPVLYFAVEARKEIRDRLAHTNLAFRSPSQCL